MSDIYLKVTIEKNWHSQKFHFLGLKNVLNSLNLKFLVAT